MPLLKNILSAIEPLKVVGSDSAEVSALFIDSRKVSAGSMFIAISGAASDGHTFIDKAIASGATVIVCEQLPQQLLPGVTYVQVKSSNKAAGLLAAAFYGKPSSKMKVVGVTGTNGKTTTTTLSFSLLKGVE